MKIIEATLIIPVTVLITMSLIAFMMGLYSDLEQQLTDHVNSLDSTYTSEEISVIRAYDRAFR